LLPKPQNPSKIIKWNSETSGRCYQQSRQNLYKSKKQD